MDIPTSLNPHRKPIVWFPSLLRNLTRLHLPSDYPSSDVDNERCESNHIHQGPPVLLSAVEQLPFIHDSCDRCITHESFSPYYIARSSLEPASDIRYEVEQQCVHTENSCTRTLLVSNVTPPTGVESKANSTTPLLSSAMTLSCPQRTGGVLLRCIDQFKNATKSFMVDIFQALHRRSLSVELYVMAMAALCSLIAVCFLPVGIEKSESQYNPQVLLDRSQTALLVEDKPNDMNILTESSSSSILTWQAAPYMLLSIGYLLFSVSGSLIAWKVWGYQDFEILPLQCCLTIGNAFSALISLLLPQSRRDDHTDDNLSIFEGYLHPSLPFLSNASPASLLLFVDPFSHMLNRNQMPFFATFMGAVVIVGGCCRTIAALFLFTIAKHRDACPHHLKSYLITSLSGTLYTITILLLFSEHGNRGNNQTDTRNVLVRARPVSASSTQRILLILHLLFPLHCP